MVFRLIFWPKEEEITREWKKLHNEYIYGFYSLIDFIRFIKSLRMGWYRVLSLRSVSIISVESTSKAVRRCVHSLSQGSLQFEAD